MGTTYKCPHEMNSTENVNGADAPVKVQLIGKHVVISFGNTSSYAIPAKARCSLIYDPLKNKLYAIALETDM